MKQIKDIERRNSITPVELRATGDTGEKRTVVGYAAKFNEESELLYGEFVEVIKPGAFDDVLQDDVRALFNHDNNQILARTKSNTLKLSVDDTGLRYEFTAPNSTAGNDLLESIKRGDVDQSSFGFQIATDGQKWERIENEDKSVKNLRQITKVARLFDVSAVTFPAYPSATVALRSLEAWKEQTNPAKDTDPDPTYTMIDFYKRRYERQTQNTLTIKL